MARNFKVFLLNDFSFLNYRYRQGIIDGIESRGNSVCSSGWFDNHLQIILLIIRIRINKSYFISSNLRSNILSMIFLRNGIIILNGIGRVKKIKFFRLLLIFLIYLNRTTKVFFIQNYADYRWIKRFVQGGEFYWSPGSGGVQRKYSDNGEFLIISRISKIKDTLGSILEFKSKTPSKLNFVGVSQAEIDTFFPSLSDEVFHGFVDQSEIFLKGSKLFHPSGYGEGIPHVVVDALVSGMEVVVTQRQFLQFGLHKLNLNVSKIEGYLHIKKRGSIDTGLEQHFILHRIIDKLYEKV